jgi:hypothetical protein
MAAEGTVMAGHWTSRVGMMLLVLAAIVAIEPQIHLKFEDRGDPRPRQFALSGEIMGQALGLVISWSNSSRLMRA